MAAKKTETKNCEDMCKNHMFKRHHHNHSGSAIYGFGVIGAAVYFVSKAVGFWGVVVALLKAVAWPAFLVYGLLKSLGL